VQRSGSSTWQPQVILIAAVIACRAVLGYSELAQSYADVREVTIMPVMA
jgi:hypothetical protein